MDLGASSLPRPIDDHARHIAHHYDCTDFCGVHPAAGHVYDGINCDYQRDHT